MRLSILIPALLAVALFSLAAKTDAGSNSVRHTGIFTDMTVTAEEGDVLGMEVFIMFSSDGMSENYYAYVQIAEGEPGTPTLSPATVVGDSISFQVPHRGTFRGKIWEKKLTGTFSDKGQAFTLPRRKSFWE